MRVAEKHKDFDTIIAICKSKPLLEVKGNGSLLHLAKRHRMIMPLFNQVKQLGSGVEVSKGLDRQAHQKIKHNFLLLRQIFSIGEKFSESNIDWLTLKGPALSQYLFGNVVLRQSNDVDILIRPEDMVRADEVVRNMGFQDQSEIGFKDMNENQKKVFLQIGHEIMYLHKDTGIKLELHWRMATPAMLFPVPEQEVWNNIKYIQLSNRQVPMLSDHHLLLYLCSHGARHLWFRLFWLRDIYELIQQKKFNLDELLIALEDKGDHRALLSALHLCHIYFDYPLSSLMHEMAQRDRTFLKVLSRCKDAVLLPEEASAPGNKENLWVITQNLMQLKRGWRFKLACLDRLKTTPKDWERLKLPNHWFFLYYFLRPFLLFGRKH